MNIPIKKMSHFLKHVYDPTDADIRQMFPDYRPWTKQQWLEAYTQNDTHFDIQNSAEIAAFALRKLGAVSTSYRLDDDQRENLERLSRGDCTLNNLSGFAGYCDTLRARQMGYVGW